MLMNNMYGAQIFHVLPKRPTGGYKEGDRIDNLTRDAL